LWKLTPLMEIRTKRGFPQRLEKAAHTTLGFFTVPTSPAAAVYLYKQLLTPWLAFFKEG
jgi:hypothetical protein